MNKPLYVQLAGLISARLNCIKLDTRDWKEKHEERIINMIDSLPHGSGIDGKTEIDFDKSNGERIIIKSEYHALNEGGFYDGWINFTLTIKPSLQFGFTMDIRGNFGKYQDVKDYLYETFSSALSEEITNE